MSEVAILKAKIREENRLRENRAYARIVEILNEERCLMVPVMVIENGSVVGRIDLRAAD